MSIIYNEENRTFTLNTDNTTYQMQVDKHKHLLHLYYGRKSEGCMDWMLSFADRGFSPNPYEAGNDRTYSLDFLPMEYAVQGSGDFRTPALILKDSDGTFGCRLKYKEYEIQKGKYSLRGLPAVYAGDSEAETLVIKLESERLGAEVSLLYGVLPGLDIITRSVRIENRGQGKITIEKLQSASLDFPAGMYDVHTFHGRHTMERVRERTSLPHNAVKIESRRGISSHQYNPFIIISDPETSETAGRCWAMELVYSGGFSAEAARDQFDQPRLMMGIAEDRFSYPLEPGDSLDAPEVIMTFSSDGFERMSHNLHKCIREHVCRGRFRDGARPILLNSWEASYFDFTGDSILGLAREAKDLGLDMIVMDDGWFGNRCDDRRALGDWVPNEKKLGCNLAELSEKINEMGIKFGIWMEPEMVSEDSDLYRSHPDWAMVIPGQKPTRGRYQLVLDLSRREVREYVFESVSNVLEMGNIEYLKWDFNSVIADAYSREEDDQGKLLYDYMIGLYEVLGRLNERYPDVLIEGCCGGGGRFDAGMMYYTPQIWCSDNTDAVDRLFIQHGTSFGYPASAVGAHVSACPNHQTGRVTPLATRAIVAMSGTFGYELDPARLSEEEKEEIREQVKIYRNISGLVRTGDYYRLSDPSRENCFAWEFASEDRSEAVVNAVVVQNHGNMATIYVKPRGLTPGVFYRDEKSGMIYAADALMDTGLPLPPAGRDAESYIYHLIRDESVNM